MLTLRARLGLTDRLIGLSMHTEADMTAGMQAAGAIAYLSKSCDPETVIAMIRQCMQQASSEPAPSMP